MDNISKDQETRKVEAEIKKLESEVKKYEQEAAASRSSRIRGWITVVSVSAGIIVSAVGIYESLTNIAYKNRQLGMEAQVRSHDIYLNSILDRMAGIKIDRQKVNENGDLKLESRESFGGATQVGAYAAAVALACEFEHLVMPAQRVLTYQNQSSLKERQIPDEYAVEMLRFLEQRCIGKSNKALRADPLKAVR